MTFAAAGNTVQATTATFSLTPAATGDFFLCSVIAESTTVSATSLSGPNITWKVLVSPLLVTNFVTIFIGVATGTAAGTQTITFSGTAPAIRAVAQEFSTTAGYSLVEFGATASQNGVTGTAYPSITPPAAGGLYWGYELNNGTAVAGTTGGYTYVVDANSNGLCFNPGCTAAVQAPAWGDTNERWGNAVLIIEQPALTVATSTLPSVQADTPYAQTLTAAGGIGSYTWSLDSGSLPSGITLSPAGVLSGTAPASAGIFTFTVKVTDSNGNTAAQPLSITVTSPPPPPPPPDPSTTFPQVPLDCRVELDLGGTWTDISSYALQREGSSPPVSITRGRSDETSSITPSTCSMQWNNRDGRFTPRNPLGAYYGLLNRNTPVRVSVPAPSASMMLEDTTTVSYAQTVALQNTTTLDVWIDADWSSYLPSVLASSGDESAFWSIIRQGDGTIELFWITSSGGFELFTSTVPVPVTGRLMLRVLLTLSTGQIDFYTAPSMTGPQTLLCTVPGSGATDIQFATGNHLYCGGSPVFTTSIPATGKIYEMQIWDGGTLIADPQFYTQIPGATSFSDAQGNTWTLEGSAVIDDRTYRGYFEAASLPQQWDTTGTDVWTPVTAAGVMRRLQQGNSPTPSAMRRAMTTSAVALGMMAYWPCEDTQGSTTIASGLSGGTAMTITGSPGFEGQAGSLSADSDFVSSAQLPTLANSSWSAPVPPGAPATAPGGTGGPDNTLTFLCLIPSDGDTTNGVLISMRTTGTIARYDIVYTTASNGTLTANLYNTAGALLVSSVQATNVNGVPILWVMNLEANGTGVNYGMQGTSVGTNAGYGGFFTRASASLGQMTQVTVNPGGLLTGTKLGHLGAMTATEPQVVLTLLLQGTSYPYASTVVNGLNPVNGWIGEPAAGRFARLCAENGLQYRIYGPPDLSQPMGAQTIDTLTNLLQYSEDSDRGMAYEPSEVLGLGYRTLRSMYRQPPGVSMAYGDATLGGDGGSGLAPTDDDTLLRNDVTINRNNGSSAQVQVTSGPSSVLPPPLGVGDYETSITVYTADDGLPLLNLASWVAWVGSTDEERYPTIPLNLARTEVASLADAVVAVRLGDHVQITGTPAWLPPGPVDQLVYGVSEQLGGFFWLLSWNTVPESPYEIAVAGTDATDSAHADTAGSQLSSGVSATATALTVATTAGPQWTTNPPDMPFDVTVGGEQMTVTAVAASGTGGTQVGVFMNPAAMGLPSWTAAQTLWTAWTGQTSLVTRVYLGGPASWTITPDMTAMIAAGVRLLISVQPAYSPAVSAADLAELQTFVASLAAAGAVCDFSIWDEPYYSGIPQAAFIDAVKYYGPAIRAQYPLVFVTAMSSVAGNTENTWYPGDAYVDKCATDIYASAYDTGDSLDLAAQPANSAVPPKPFGIWELNGSLASTGQTAAQVAAFFAYVQSYMAGRLAAGQPNDAVCMFSGAPGESFLGCAATQNAGFEGGAGNWASAGNSTIAVTTAQAHSGTSSLAMTAQAAGSQIQAASCSAGAIATQGMPVAPGQVVDGAAWFRAAATGRTCEVGVQFFTSAGAAVGSNTYGTAVTDTTTGWVQAKVTVTAPATAAYVRLLPQVTQSGITASEVHYVDDCELRMVTGPDPVNVTTIEFGWDSRVGLWETLHAALNNTSGPQVMTVTRSVNGVVKAQAAGTSVNVYPEPVVAL